MAVNAKDVTLILHIGLHKTATTYIQNQFSLHRHDLLDDGILYPIAGQEVALVSRTRDGAQSGHALYTRPVHGAKMVQDLRHEMPDSTKTVLLSSEELCHPRFGGPQDHLKTFEEFGHVEVVVVLRRQDDWIESFYKQGVDQHRNFETRSFAEYLAAEGPQLLDYHARFAPWRDAVGPDNFHVLSYDDDGDGVELGRRILQIAGATPQVLDRIGGGPVERYDSVHAIDTVGLRILNACRLPDRDERVRLARAIYAVAPKGDIVLNTDVIRAGIQQAYADVNARIERDWFGREVPNLRFAQERQASASEVPTSEDLLRYVDDVLRICASAAPAAAAAEET